MVDKLHESESRPVPDPTALTTDQLRRELQSLKDLIFTRMDGSEKTFADAVEHLEDLSNEKFQSIEKQFKERDTRVEQSSRDSKVAVDAALSAAKEAVGENNKSNAASNSKMESAFTKQIDLLGNQITTAAKSTDDKFADIKDRLTMIEGRTLGGEKNKEDHTQSLVIAISIAAVVVTIIIAVVTRMTGTPQVAPQGVYQPLAPNGGK